MNHTIDFAPPEWLIAYYTVVGSLAVVFNVFGTYLLVFECRELGDFRYYKILFLTTGAWRDFHVNILFKPIALFPILAGYHVGLLSKFIENCIIVSTAVLIVSSVIYFESLLLCFVIKHQSLAEINTKHVLPKWFLYFGYFVAICVPIGSSIWVPMMMPTKDEQWKFLRQTYSEYEPKFISLSDFLIVIPSVFSDLFELLLFAGVCAILGLFIVFMVDMFLILKVLETKMSKSTLQKHKYAERALRIQFGTSMFSIIPIGTVIFSVYWGVENAQLLAHVAIACAGCHSVLNICSMMIFFPPYRRFLGKCKQKRTTVVKVSTAPTM